MVGGGERRVRYTSVLGGPYLYLAVADLVDPFVVMDRVYSRPAVDHVRPRRDVQLVVGKHKVVASFAVYLVVATETVHSIVDIGAVHKVLLFGTSTIASSYWAVDGGRERHPSSHS